MIESFESCVLQVSYTTPKISDLKRICREEFKKIGGPATGLTPNLEKIAPLFEDMKAEATRKQFHDLCITGDFDHNRIKNKCLKRKYTHLGK